MEKYHKSNWRVLSHLQFVGPAARRKFALYVCKANWCWRIGGVKIAYLQTLLCAETDIKDIKDIKDGRCYTETHPDIWLKEVLWWIFSRKVTWGTLQNPKQLKFKSKYLRGKTRCFFRFGAVSLLFPNICERHTSSPNVMRFHDYKICWSPTLRITCFRGAFWSQTWYRMVGGMPSTEGPWWLSRHKQRNEQRTMCIYHHGSWFYL